MPVRGLSRRIRVVNDFADRERRVVNDFTYRERRVVNDFTDRIQLNT